MSAIETAPTQTRQSLLDAATWAFSRTGFDGSSVRGIERLAKVNRGLLNYHFGSKDLLWREVITRQMDYFHAEFKRFSDLLAVVEPSDRGRVLLKVYVNFSAKHPELLRMLASEGSTRNERLEWFVSEHLSRTVAFFNKLSGTTGTPRAEAVAYYILTGASAYVFAVSEQCKLLFGVDPNEPDFIVDFAEAVANINFEDILST